MTTDYGALAKRLLPYLQPALGAGGTAAGVAAHTHNYLTKAEADARYLMGGSFDGAGLVYDGGVLAVGQGDGLTVSADAVGLTTPGTLTESSTNSAVGSHTHAVTASENPGAAASLLKSTSGGGLTLVTLDATTKVRTPTVDTASGALALAPNSGTVNLPAGGVLGTASGNYTLAPAGDVTLDPGGDDVFVAASTRVGTANYASQTTGWRVDYAGGGDFRYLFVDEMHAKSFVADLEQALAGGQVIAKSVAMVSRAFTLPAAGASATLYVRDLPSAENMAVFQANDVVRLRTFSRAAGSLTIADAWGVVTSYSDLADKEQSWTFTRSAGADAGTATGTIAADSLVLDYGTAGQGVYEVNAIDGAYGANSPWLRFETWDSHPRTRTVALQLGKLTGLSGIGEAGEYGLYVRGANAGDYLLASPVQGVNLVAAAGAVSITEDNGIDITLGASAVRSRSLSFVESGTVYGEIWALRNGSDTAVEVIAREANSASEAQVALRALHSHTTSGRALVTIIADGGNAATDVFMLLDSDTSGPFALIQGPNLMLNGPVMVGGSDAPSSRLHVRGATPDVRVASTSADQNVTLSFYDNDSTLKGRLIYAGAGATGGKLFGLVNYDGDYLGMLSDEHRWMLENGVELMRLTSTGLGIGATATEKLHVSGKVLAQAVQVTTDPGSGTAGRISFVNGSNWTLSTGDGSIKTVGTTARQNAAWLKVYIGTAVCWVPVWDNIS